MTKLTKTIVADLTRTEFEKLVYEAMLNPDEYEIFYDYKMNVTAQESAQRLNMSVENVYKMRKKLRRKLEKLI